MSHPPRSSKEALLAEHITEALSEFHVTQAQRHQISSSFAPGIVDALDMYLTIAGNSLAESQWFLGSGKLSQAQRSLELAKTELRFSCRLLQTHEGDGDSVVHQQLTPSMNTDQSIHNHESIA